MRDIKMGLSRAVSPVVLEAAVEATAAQGEDGVGTAGGPEHAGLFETLGDHGAAGSLDHSRADEQALSAEYGITHAFLIPREILGLSGAELTKLFADGGKLLNELHQGFDLALIESIQAAGQKTLPRFLVMGKQLGAQIVEMLAGVIKIDDFHGAGEVLGCEVPDPDGAVGQDDSLFGAAPAAAPSLGVET